MAVCFDCGTNLEPREGACSLHDFYCPQCDVEIAEQERTAEWEHKVQRAKAVLKKDAEMRGA